MDVLGLRAESAGIVLGVDCYLFHPQVEYAYYPPIPSYPNFSAKVFRSHRVIGLGYLDVSVAVN